MLPLLVTSLLVTLVLVTTSRDAVAQSLVCYTIKPGDTTSAVARRLTGRPDTSHESWFQIVDPARSTVISKNRYNRVVPGWRACVPATLVAPHGSGSSLTPAMYRNDTDAPFDGPRPMGAPQAPTGAGAPRDKLMALAYLYWAAAAFGAVIGVGWHMVHQFLKKRRALMRLMQHFGDVFVKDFERPLVVEGVTDRPILARLRCMPAGKRLDILLAPAAGRRYPNLDDHRHNVEYDVDRIANRLRHHPFDRKPLRAEGQWVVIPFQLKPRPKTGAVA